MFKRVFGSTKKQDGPAQSPAPSPSASKGATTQSSIQALDEDIDLHTKKWEKYEKEVKEQGRLAVEAHRKKDDRRAKLHMRKRKAREQNMANLESYIQRLEQQKNSLEGMADASRMAKSMQQANSAMSRNQRELDPDKIDSILDENEEFQSNQRELEERLAQPMAGDEDIDMDTELAKLDDELEGEEKEETQSQKERKEGEKRKEEEAKEKAKLEELPKAPQSSALSDLPQPPTSVANADEEDEELKELEKLQADMSL